MVYVDEAGFDNRDDCLRQSDVAFGNGESSKMITRTVIAPKGKDVMHSNLGKEKKESVGLPHLKKEKYSHR